MPSRRHETIREANSLNQKCEAIIEEIERRMELAEKKLAELEDAGNKSKKAKRRLRRFLEAKKAKIENIQKTRTILTSIIQDNRHLTDDMIRAIFPARKNIIELVASHRHMQKKVKMNRKRGRRKGKGKEILKEQKEGRGKE